MFSQTKSLQDILENHRPWTCKILNLIVPIKAKELLKDLPIILNSMIVCVLF